jgi:pimeloyl-ACP methyl ester carboxylesterase/DNA-binding winged helix-turn-helix (wHTH) protein
MRISSRKLYKFGRFSVDPDERLLFDGNDVISLTPKAFDTLLFLIQNVGHVLSKEEIMERVWPESFVEENNLAQNISILRRSLGERIEGAKFIETVPKRGYRFVAPVETASSLESDSVTVERIHATISYEEEIEAGEGGYAPGGTVLPPSPAILSIGEFRPETHYVQNGDVNIAYQVVGDGPIDIVFVMGWVSHLEYFWKHHLFASFLNRLASFSRLILFDKRGTGLSDRVPLNELPTLEQRMEDVHAVMDAVGSERAVLIGVSEGGPMCSLFAATYPERTSALVMIGTYAKRVYDDDYPWAPTEEQREAFYDQLQHDWGKPVGIEDRAPSMADDEEFRDWWATYLRMGASPGAAVALTKMNADIDVRDVLPSIRVPTLVIHRSGDLCLKVDEGRFVASKIPGCRYVELGGIDHLPFVGNQDEILDEIEQFVTSIRFAGEYDRVLATVLIVRVVNFEAFLQREGLRKRARAFVSRQLKRLRGKGVSYDDGRVQVIFDGPARAIRCAEAMVEYAGKVGFEVRTGLHTGECDVVGDDFSGFAVELAKKIADESRDGEILVSRTVKDLVAGSGLSFSEFGVRVFEGVDGAWRLFSVR